MTSQLLTHDTLTVGVAAGAAVPSFAPTLASLPVSFTPAIATDSLDVAIIGGGAQWALEVADAIRNGSRGVVVSNPAMTDPAEVIAAATLADERGVLVVLAEPYAGDPGLLAHQTDIVNHLAAVDTLSVKYVSADDDSPNQLLAVLRTARAVGYPTIRLSSFVDTEHGFTAAGVAANGAVFGALGVRSSAAVAGQSIRGYGFARTVELELFGTVTATPARITYTNVDGRVLVPSVYETADRAAWRHLADELKSTVAQRRNALRDFATDIETVLSA